MINKLLHSVLDLVIKDNDIKLLKNAPPSTKKINFFVKKQDKYTFYDYFGVIVRIIERLEIKDNISKTSLKQFIGISSKRLNDTLKILESYNIVDIYRAGKFEFIRKNNESIESQKVIEHIRNLENIFNSK